MIKAVILSEDCDLGRMFEYLFKKWGILEIMLQQPKNSRDKYKTTQQTL